MAVFGTALRMKRVSTVSTPPAGTDALYFKTDGNAYVKNPEGVERPLFPAPDQLHQNSGFDLTAPSTEGNTNTGAVASRDMPTGWGWGWSFPNTALAYPTLVSDATTTRLGTGRSLKISWAGNQGINQYVMGTPWSAPVGSVIKVSAWVRSSAAHMAATVGVLSANSSDPSVFTSGYLIQSSSQAVSVGAWTKVTYTAVVPQGHTHARLVIVATNNSVGAGDVWLDDTESEMQILPPVLGNIAAYREVAADFSMSNPTSWTVIPNSTERTALTRSFVKQSSDTKLIVSASCSLGNASGLLQVYDMGLRVGGTDYAVARAVMQQAASYENIAGAGRELSGIAAGTLTIEPVFRSSAGTSMYFGASYSTISYQVREVP